MAKPEEDICIRLMAHIRDQYPWAKYHVFHVPNAGKRKPHYLAKLYAMGLLPGVSDYVLSHPRTMQMLYLEVKTETGAPTQNQLAFIAAKRDSGHVGLFGYGYKECELIVDSWFNQQYSNIEWMQYNDKKSERNAARKARAAGA